MIRYASFLSFLFLSLCSCVSLARPAQVKTINATITEPGIIALDQLYKMSDVVAVVHILSGDTENYERAIYKTEVIQNFKGATSKEVLYFGPYVGEKLGMDVLVFLKAAAEPVVPKSKTSTSYGTVKYFEVFNEGYSRMEIDYRCIFGGKDTDQECDYGVRVCTDYITLPKGMNTSPPMREDTPFGCRWVRKSKFILMLEKIESDLHPALND